MTLRLAAIPDESCDSENDDATSVYSTDSQVGQRHESTSFSFYVQAQKVLKMRRRRNQSGLSEGIFEFHPLGRDIRAK